MAQFLSGVGPYGPLVRAGARAAAALPGFEMSDGLGAIFPSMMNSIIALRCLGYSVDDPQFIRAMDEFEKLGIEEDDTFRMQPCMSPVWDTAYALFALGRREFRRAIRGW